MKHIKAATGVMATARAALAAWATLVLSMAATAQGSDASALIQASEQRIKSTTEKTLYRMELRDAGGQVTQTREIELHYKRQGSSETTLFKFTAPPVVQGTGLLIVDEGKAVNDIWMYVPATRRVRRIAGAEKSNWFMGTEFTHEDFEDYKAEAYAFRLEQDNQPCGSSQRCSVVGATASDATERDASGYGRKVYWIEKESLYPIRIDYIDRSGSAVKKLEVARLEKSGAYWRPQVYEMRNLVNGRSTRLTALSRQVDVPLDEHFVSQRYLRAD